VTPTLRIRLTALYGGLFVVFVAILMAASYWLMGRHLDRTLPAPEADAALAQLGTQYLIALLGATLVATTLGWALAGRELASAAEAFAARERFVANAGHELRSPLTIIRTEVDVALADPDATVDELRAMGGDVLETVDRMDGLLDGLMALVQSGRPLARREPVDLAAVARARSGAWAPARSGCASTCGPRPCAASSGCSSASPRTCWRTGSATTRRAASSPSTPARATARRCCASSTAARGSPPRRRGGCSSRSSAAAGRATTVARGSGSRSSGRSPRRTAGASPSARGQRAGCPSMS